MSNAGFGDYSWSPQLDVMIGFGDPYYDNIGREVGFGSPYDLALTPIGISAPVIGDDGGALLTIYGAFVAGQEYPISLSRLGEDYPCFGGISTRIDPIASGTQIRCYAPKVARGIYSLKVGDLVLDNAIKVIRRNKCREAYSLKTMLPSFFNAGARLSNQDNVSDFNNLESILLSVGQVVQELQGKPMTISTSEWKWEDTSLLVETTLGFPSSGSISVDGFLFSYSEKTDTSFEGISRLKVTTHTIRKGVEVTYYDL